MSSPETEWNAAELGAMVGIGERHVKRLAQQGILPKVRRGRYGPEAIAAYCDYLRDDSRRGGADFVEERARLTRARADQEELLLAKTRGELIDAGEARKTVFELARAERDAHLSWVSRTAPAIASETGVDPTRLYAALDRHMRDHLADLADVVL